MTLEEYWEIKDKMSKETYSLTLEQLREYYRKSTELFLNKAGRENFIPTDKPNVWKHIPKKAK